MPPYPDSIPMNAPENNPIKSLNVYEELRPKNEPRFLMKVRDVEKAMGFLTPLKWKNIMYLTLTHAVTLTWLMYSLCKGKYPKWQTALFGIFYCYAGAFGVTGGAHRYWTHRCFKAEKPLQWLLAICFSISGQNTIIAWVRDHRVHHKFSETSADPHNANRGFFFSHMGWLMMSKHPDVVREGSKIDTSDITNDPVVQFHTKYFYILRLILCFVVPISIPMMLWEESWEVAAVQQFFVIFIYTPHCIWAVNSFAHFYGNRPYNPKINPGDNWCVSLFSMGEGWHNYHHAFPWDYKAAELPYFVNLSTVVLDAFAAIGWAHHLKQASPQLIQAHIQATLNSSKKLQCS